MDKFLYVLLYPVGLARAFGHWISNQKLSVPLPDFKVKNFGVAVPLPKFSIKDAPLPINVNYIRVAVAGVVLGAFLYVAAQSGYKPSLPDLTNDVRVAAANLVVRPCAPTETETCPPVRGLVKGDEVNVVSDGGEWCKIGDNEFVACRFLIVKESD